MEAPLQESSDHGSLFLIASTRLPNTSAVPEINEAYIGRGACCLPLHTLRCASCAQHAGK